MSVTQAIRQARKYIDRGEIDAAEKITVRLRRERRSDTELEFLEGCIQYKRGNFTGAAALFERVLRRSPDDVNALVNLGVALLDAGMPADARAHLQRVVERRPDHFIAWYNLGNACRATEHLRDARDAYLRAIACRPDYHPAHNNLGFVTDRLGLYEEAVTAYRRAIELKPSPDTYVNLLHVLKRRDPAATQALLYEALARFDAPELMACALPSATNLCAWPLVDRIRECVLAYARAPDSKAAIVQDLLLPLNACPDIDSAELLAVHQNWARRLGQVEPLPGAMPAAPLPGERLRIAYLSGDFNGHAVGLFLRHVLACHDRAHCEIICYSTSGQRDDVTREMERRVDAFVDVSALDDVALAHRIRADGVHVLVDLGGHTLNTRVAVLRYRAAPVQVTYLGYPNTTGLAETDYRITDGYAEAADGTQYTERLVMMPESFLCFGSFAERPRPAEPPAVRKGYVTFGSFNHTRKLTPAAVRLWSRILQQVPGSRLLLKASLAGEACVQANLYEAFAAEGIGRERLELRGFTATRESHLDCYNEVDIALDTFPYHGTTTTCEALWMGVPVVTLAGKVHAQRVTYSILKNIGVEETIAWTEEEYAGIAVGLARDLAALGRLRERIPVALRGSILCDPVRFTRQLEDLYQAMWKEKSRMQAGVSRGHGTGGNDGRLEQARVLLIGGQPAEARALARRVLDGAPDDINALFVTGTACYQQADYRGAIDALARAVALVPDFIDAHLNLGAAYDEAGKPAEAEAHYREVLARRPDHPVALNNLGKLCYAGMRLDEAHRALEASVRHKADYWVSWFNLGNVCSAQGDYETAVAHFRRSLAIERHPEVYAALISVLKRNDAYGEACRLAEEFVAQTEKPADALLPVATIFYESCAWRTVERIQPAVLALAADDATRNPYRSNILLDLNTRPDIDPRLQFELHRRWGAKTPAQVRTYDHYPAALAGQSRLRIGYLSPDFRSHAVGLFIGAVITAHDGRRVEVICYAKSAALDEMTQRITARAHRFVDVSMLTDEQIARRIHEDGIHILVDLAGHTAETGMSVLRYRAAPVQVTYLGYPNTTGLAETDYRITDGYAEAADGTQYTERLVMMPESFLCFGSFAERPRPAEPPAVRKGYVTFGSFNHTRKLTPAAVRLWSRILQQVPGSRLLLKASLAGEACVQANLYEAFAAEGIGRERLELRGFTATRESHLDCYNEVDIALDTFPYHGTTTTCEALWMGVPVVTLAGKVHAQRVTYSILKNIGVEETIAWTEEEYAGIAVGLARDLAALGRLRERIPVALRGSILCDPVRFTRQLEDLYQAMWKERGAALLAAVHPARPGHWIDRMQDMAYLSPLLPSWARYLEEQSGSEGWRRHQQALDLYFDAQGEDIDDRRVKLAGAYRLLAESMPVPYSLSVAQTFMRVAVELGEMEPALMAATAVVERVMAQESVDLSEPFLPALARYEQVTPMGDMKWWVLASVLELRDRLLVGNLGYVDSEAAEALELICRLGYGCGYAEGRLRALSTRPETDVSRPEEALADDGTPRGDEIAVVSASEPSPVRLPQERTVRVIHNLARSGGTLISRCLGCMEGVVLLSEIHPKGGARFNPVMQAQEWFQLFDERELADIRAEGRMNFVRQIDLIERRCHELGKQLVIRDWAHVDFHAVPFTPTACHEFTTANVLAFSGSFRLSRIALTRHPLDQWMSLSRIALIHGQLTLEDFLRGYRRYAEQCVEIGFARYEDFVARPDEVMQWLCTRLELAYDGRFLQAWPDYTRITGDMGAVGGRREITVGRRREFSPLLLERCLENEDYRVAIELFGYRHPG